MNKKHTVVRMFLNEARKIDVIEHRIEFTADQFPGVVSVHIGVRAVEPTLNEDATDAQIIAVLDQVLTPTIGQLEAYHLNDLEWQYKLSTSVIVEREVQPVVYPDLTARQLRLGLVTNGFSLSQIDAAILALPEGQAKELAKIEWEYATTYTRTHPLIASVSAALGLTDAQTNAMWLSALVL
jgi:hypothetical protein